MKIQEFRFFFCSETFLILPFSLYGTKRTVTYVFGGLYLSFFIFNFIINIFYYFVKIFFHFLLIICYFICFILFYILIIYKLEFIIFLSAEGDMAISSPFFTMIVAVSFTPQKRDQTENLSSLLLLCVSFFLFQGSF